MKKKRLSSSQVNTEVGTMVSLAEIGMCGYTTENVVLQYIKATQGFQNETAKELKSNVYQKCFMVTAPLSRKK